VFFFFFLGIFNKFIGKFFLEGGNLNSQKNES